MESPEPESPIYVAVEDSLISGKRVHFDEKNVRSTSMTKQRKHVAILVLGTSIGVGGLLYLIAMTLFIIRHCKKASLQHQKAETKSCGCGHVHSLSQSSNSTQTHGNSTQVN
jgi:hypothetical protein